MKKRILTLLILLNLALIWGNSLLTGDTSGAVSGGVLAFVGRFLPVLLTEAGHTFLRGLLFCGRHRLVRQETPLHLMGFGLAVACIDETIQIFTPGRASSLIDVWIDTWGFALGFAVILTASFIFRKIKGEH